LNYLRDAIPTDGSPVKGQAWIPTAPGAVRRYPKRNECAVCPA
jgi:hypothetical protein